MNNEIFLIVILVFPVLIWPDPAHAQPGYEIGSVYNLKRYLPGHDDDKEIIVYPLGCSVNTIADSTLQAFFPQDQGSFSEVFETACVRHDLCYRHGHYTYDFSKDDCDQEFANLLTAQCYNRFQETQLNQCQFVADILILAAEKFGQLSYHSKAFWFTDYGYYYEYLANRKGRYSLFWALLKENQATTDNLLSTPMIDLDKLRPVNQIKKPLVDFFEKKTDLRQLLSRINTSTQE